MQSGTHKVLNESVTQTPWCCIAPSTLPNPLVGRTLLAHWSYPCSGLAQLLPVCLVLSTLLRLLHEGERLSLLLNKGKAVRSLGTQLGQRFSLSPKPLIPDAETVIAFLVVWHYFQFDDGSTISDDGSV